MTRWNDWRDYLGPELEKAHRAWFRRGREGRGRIELTGVDLLQVMTSNSNWSAARFVRCRFDAARANYTSFDEAELTECGAIKAELSTCKFERTIFKDCNFAGCDFILCSFRGARMSGCDFGGAFFGRSQWNGAVVERVSFREAAVFGARLDEGRFIECDFNGALMRDTEPYMKLCTTRGTRFERCDLRGTSWDGRLLAETVFDRCQLCGVKGKPIMAGPVTLIAPDFSEAGDGSDVRPDGELPEAWRA